MIEEGFSLISALGDSNFLPSFLKHASPFNEALMENFEAVDLAQLPPSPYTLGDLFNSDSVPQPPARGESTIDVYANQNAHWGYLDELHDRYISELKSDIDDKITELEKIKGPEAERLRDELSALRKTVDQIQSEIRAILLEKVEVTKPILADKSGEYSERLKAALEDFKIALNIPDERYVHTESSLSFIKPGSGTQGLEDKFFDGGSESKTDNFTRSFPGARFLEELFSPFSKRNS